MKLSVLYTRNWDDFKPLFRGLKDEFTDAFPNTMKQWCGIERDPAPGYWQVWIMKLGKKTVGICGLYTMHPHNKKDMWLGWFGVTKKHRGMMLGDDMLEFIEKRAKKLGCKNLYSNMYRHKRPWPFYKRNGFELLCTARQFVDTFPGKFEMGEFENPGDYIICKQLK